VAYRDELESARARITALESQLADERAERERLEKQLTAPNPAPDPPAAIVPVARRLGRIYYHPPPCRWPLLRLHRAAIRAAIARRPRLGSPKSDNVLLWVGWVVALPLVYFVWLPLYVLAQILLLPIATLIILAASLVLAPLHRLARLSFSPDPPDVESTFSRGAFTETHGAQFLWALLCFLPPLLVPCIGLLTSADD
jgi:hypothetical protein